MQSKIENRNPKIVIVGAGPAGASLAIRLARANFRVRLIERERFPRRKLCGEFISPECLRHFQDLGVFDEMLAAGGDRISETVFYAADGKSVGIPSKWFGGNRQEAMSLSRAEMDFRLLEKARQCGVEVSEETQVVNVLFGDDRVCGVKVKSKNGETREVTADLTIDATGRANVLTKFVEREINSKVKIQNLDLLKAKNHELKIDYKIGSSKPRIQDRLVGFKTHLRNVDMEKGRCEIYFFSGGYGGLSFVENNLANHCFLLKAEVVREFGGNAEKIVERVVFQNRRAFQTLRGAVPVADWLAVSVEGFGRRNLNPAANLFVVGDAGAFIDPFTGSGMLMAFESAEILARLIAENRFAPEGIHENYQILHRRKFQARLRVCSVLRRAAFVPAFAKSAIFVLNRSAKLREITARATRQPFSVADKPVKG